MHRYFFRLFVSVAFVAAVSACGNVSGNRRQMWGAGLGHDKTETAPAVEVASGNKVADGLELPAPLASGDEQILKRVGYTVSYNAKTLQPNWVAWRLTYDRTTGAAKRSGQKFCADEEVPVPRAEDSDYRSSGYDRGHMCPAGDNKGDYDAMRESCLLSNICPQAPSLNRGDWNEMEIACRKWAKEYGAVYVVCGPVFYKSVRHKRIGAHKIPVPEAFFKVVLCMEGTPKAIGFIYKNADGNRPKGDYVNTVDEVERITGLDFFPALPDDVEARVEASCSLDDWE